MTPDEEAFEAARLGHLWAGSCAPDRAGGDCGWYHGSWQVLRLLGLMASSGTHAAHYRAALDDLAARGGAGAFLITGSADHALLALLAGAWRGPAAPAFTVLDRCDTPLKLCRWYAGRHGLALATRHQDALDPLPEAGFDAVFTHAFMGNFDAAGRARLAGRWAQALRPGGRLVTVQRVREGAAETPLGFAPAEAEAFAARAAALAAQRPERFAGWDVAAMAREYARRFRTVPVGSAEGLRGTLEAAGFRLLRFERQASAGPRGVTGPSVPNTDGYFLIVAERLASSACESVPTSPP
jgi:SAM-dependent methyltransferase